VGKDGRACPVNARPYQKLKRTAVPAMCRADEFPQGEVYAILRLGG